MMLSSAASFSPHPSDRSVYDSHRSLMELEGTAESSKHVHGMEHKGMIGGSP